MYSSDVFINARAPIAVAPMPTAVNIAPKRASVIHARNAFITPSNIAIARLTLLNLAILPKSEPACPAADFTPLKKPCDVSIGRPVRLYMNASLLTSHLCARNSCACTFLRSRVRYAVADCSDSNPSRCNASTFSSSFMFARARLAARSNSPAS